MLRWLVKVIAYPFYKLMFWSKWVNKRELKKYQKQPVIFAVNHRSGFDGPTLFIDIPRKIYVWIKGEFFRTRGWRNFLTKMGGIPVHPGAELALMRDSQKVLTNNQALVVMPTGHRSFDGADKLQVRNGVAMVALRTGVPIVPIVMNRRIKFWRLTKFKIGDAIDSKQYLVDGRVTKDGVNRLGNALQEQMQTLLNGFAIPEKQPAWQTAPNIIARGIVIRGNQLLAIKRHKAGQTYYVLPGGHAEPNETITETCTREVLEETGVTVRPFRDLYKYWYEDQHGRGNGYQTFFVCEYQSGEPHPTDAEEYTQPNRITGTYEPVWLGMDQIKDVDLRPTVMKKQLLKDYHKKGARLPFPLRLLKSKA